MSAATNDILISAEELRDLLTGPRPSVRILDVRWQLGGPPGRAAYLNGHLPGAVFVDLETELSAPATAESGRHPLPDVAALQAAARRWGLSPGDLVVAYDDTANLAAARLWWLMRWSAGPPVRLLDGGLSAWRAVGGALETIAVQTSAGDVVLAGPATPVLALDQVLPFTAAGGVLLDARAGERYRGEVEPVDPVAGHIPGAVSAPTTENLAADGRFKLRAELVERFAALGARPGEPVGVYCGSGVTAAHEAVALAIAGIEATLYPGSWSQWCATPGCPIATGAG